MALMAAVKICVPFTGLVQEYLAAETDSADAPAGAAPVASSSPASPQAATIAETLETAALGRPAMRGPISAPSALQPLVGRSVARPSKRDLCCANRATWRLRT